MPTFTSFGGAHNNGGPSLNNNGPDMLNFGSSSYYASNDSFAGGSAIQDDELFDSLGGAHGLPASNNDFNNMNMAFSRPNQMFDLGDISGFSNPNNDMSQRFAQSMQQRSNGFNTMGTNDIMQQNNRPTISPNTRSVINGTNALNLSATQGLPMNNTPAMNMNVGSFPNGAVNMEATSSSNSNMMRSSSNIPMPITTGAQNSANNNNPSWMPNGTTTASFSHSLHSPANMSPNNRPAANVMSEFMFKGGASMPANIGTAAQTPSSTVEAKRRRRRESHNMVERRRRDNINERIQDLSKIVPYHRLEDDKIRKLLANGTPLSPGLGGSGRRTGAITTGLPPDEKDKGPNKGDILNASVAWMRDLIWMNQVLLRQVEELNSKLRGVGINPNLEASEDQKRMQSEINNIIERSEAHSYSRTNGSGLRVPHFTDYKGNPLTEEQAQQEEENGTEAKSEFDQAWSSLDAPGELKEVDEDGFMDF